MLLDLAVLSADFDFLEVTFSFFLAVIFYKFKIGVASSWGITLSLRSDPAKSIIFNKL